MRVPNQKPRLAVISPFLGKSFGTERMVVEWIAHLAGDFEIHIYSQSVEDVDLSKVTWHKIPKLRGPHLINYLWWFSANHLWRRWDRHFQGLEYDLIFSPGTNCFDADAVSVHIVFAEFLDRVKPELRFSRNPARSWPRLLHRRLYYRLVAFLEGRVYTNRRTQLILTSPQSEQELHRFYGCGRGLPVVSTGLDHEVFSAPHRLASRERARQELGLAADCFAVLLIGNDLRKKGIRTLLGALEELSSCPIHLMVVCRENPAPFRTMISSTGLEKRVHFLPPRKDVEFYYAATDAYVGPSLEDTFALPAAEAMACGLPVIISSRAGAAAWITHGVDGLILDDPADVRALAEMIRHLYEDREFDTLLGEKAATTARQYTWQRSSRELATIFDEILRRKASFVTRISTQEP
jgi:glycosyltransferase involved in cell wall biosynthesis